MSENTAAAACTQAEWEAARDAGLLISTTAEERAIHAFAVAVRADLLEALELLLDLHDASGMPDTVAAQKARAVIAAAKESA